MSDWKRHCDAKRKTRCGRETIHMLPSDDEVDALVLGKTGVFFTVAFSHELSPTDDDLQREWHALQLEL